MREHREHMRIKNQLEQPEPKHSFMRRSRMKIATQERRNVQEKCNVDRHLKQVIVYFEQKGKTEPMLHETAWIIRNEGRLSADPRVRKIVKLLEQPGVRELAHISRYLYLCSQIALSHPTSVQPPTRDTTP